MPILNFQKQIRQSWSDLCTAEVPPKGITDLNTLLKNITPIVQDELFVFVTVAEEEATEYLSSARMIFRESEGVTLILPKSELKTKTDMT